MASIAALSVDLDANSVAFQRDMRRASRAVSSGSARMNRSLSRLDRGFDRSRRGVSRWSRGIVGMVLSTAAALGLGKIAGEFEDLRLALKTVTGSAKGAGEAFAFIQDTAAKTPFSVQTMTQAFITLQATGIKPTNDLLMMFSDAASVTTNKLETFQAMVRVFSRGVQGGLGLEELNQIADRGLPVWDIFKQKLGISRLEISEVGKTAEGAAVLLKTLEEGIRERFGGATADALGNLTTKVSNFGDAFDKAADSLARNIGLMQLYKGALSNGTENMEKLADWFENSTPMQWWRDLWGISSNTLTETKKGVDALKKSLSGDTDAGGLNIEGPVEKFTKTLARDVIALTTRNLTLGESEGVIARVNREQELANLLQDENIKLTADQTRYANLLFQQYEEGTDRLIESAEAADLNKRLFKDMGDAFSSAAEQMIVDGGRASDVLKGLMKDIQRALFRRTIGAGIDMAMNSLFSSASTSAGGSYVDNNGILQARASGGPVFSNRPYLVGEEGPELMVPGGSGTIIPNDRLVGASGGQNITIQQSFDFRGAGAGVFAQAAKFKEEIKRETLGALMDAVGQGGTVSAAFGRARLR